MPSVWAGKLVYDAQAFHGCFVNANSNFDVLNVSSCHSTLPEPTHQQKGNNSYLKTEFLVLSSSPWEASQN